MTKLVASFWFVLTMTGTVLAKDLPSLKFDLPQRAGGTASEMVEILAGGLRQKGYKVTVTLSGNCAVTKRNITVSSDPVVTFWSNRVHLQTGAECQMPEPTKATFVTVIYHTPEFICAVSDRVDPQDLFNKAGKFTISVQPFPWQTGKMIAWLRTNSKADLTPVVYRNSGAQSVAAAAKETDFFIGTAGLVMQKNGLVRCAFNTGNHPIKNTVPLKAVNDKKPMSSYVLQYMLALNLSADQITDLRNHMHDIMRQPDWQAWLSSRDFEDLSLLDASVQIDFVRTSIQDLR